MYILANHAHFTASNIAMLLASYILVVVIQLSDINTCDA